MVLIADCCLGRTDGKTVTSCMVSGETHIVQLSPSSVLIVVVNLVGKTLDGPQCIWRIPKTALTS
jgi:hypothetical protein